MFKVIRNGDQLIHAGHPNSPEIQQKTEAMAEHCENFMQRLDDRRRNVAMSLAFFKSAQTVSAMIETMSVYHICQLVPSN